MGKKSVDYVNTFLDSGIDIPGSTIYLKGEIDNDTLDIITSGFHLMPPANPVLVLINSPGGCTYAGMGIYDIIRAHKGQVTTRVVGEACSMGCVILQAGDIREASENSVLMHHVGETAYSSNHPRNIKERYKFNERHDNRIDALMLERVNEYMRKMGESEWTMSKWKERDTWDRWYFADEAIKAGLLDRIWRG